MTILKMTATFGKLANETLTLRPGMNVLTLPNESGKTTWSQFITAMFYGIATSVKASKNVLPVKTKYKPWSGESMSGVIELLHEGRAITIERRAKGNVPFGTFRAYDTETGQDIPELTAENCGVILLGCERNVFERSAMLRQNAMEVTSDDALTRRLTSLVSTGSETVNYEQTKKLLHGAFNRIKNNLLPQAQAGLAAASDALLQIHEQHKRDISVTAACTETEAEIRRLDAVLSAISAQEYQQKLRQKTQALEEMRLCEAAAEEKREAVRALPDRAVLQTLQNDLSEDQPLPEKPFFAPKCEVFSGLSAEKARQMAKDDVSTLDQLAPKRAARPLPFGLLCALCLIAAAVFFVLKNLYVGASLLVPTAVFGILFGINLAEKQKIARNALAAKAILSKYALPARDDILTAAIEYVTEKEAFDENLRQYEAALSAKKEKLAGLMGQVSMFSTAKTPEEAKAAVSDALDRFTALHNAEQAYGFAKKRYESVCAVLGDASAPAAPQIDTSGYTRASAEAMLAAAKTRLRELQNQQAQGQGRVAALGDSAVLTAQKEAFEAEIAQLREKLAAFELAENTLADANAELQTRFSPKICKLAGTYLEKLTGTRYDALTLDTAMKTTARESEPALTREIAYLSSGTADQVYLALRLAIVSLALSEDTPIILDDALIRFDDLRLRSALRLLQEQSISRQILLFTCQSREESILKGEGL